MPTQLPDDHLPIQQDIQKQIFELEESFKQTVLTAAKKVTATNPSSQYQHLEDYKQAIHELRESLLSITSDLSSNLSSNQISLIEQNTYFGLNRQYSLHELTNNKQELETYYKDYKKLIEESQPGLFQMQSLLSLIDTATYKEQDMINSLVQLLEEQLQLPIVGKRRTEEMAWFAGFKDLIQKELSRSGDADNSLIALSIRGAIDSLPKGLSPEDTFGYIMKTAINNYQEETGLTPPFKSDKRTKGDTFKDYDTKGAGLNDVIYLETTNDGLRINTVAANLYKDNQMEGTQLARHNFKLAIAKQVFKKEMGYTNEDFDSDITKKFGLWLNTRLPALSKIGIDDTEIAIEKLASGIDDNPELDMIYKALAHKSTPSPLTSDELSSAVNALDSRKHFNINTFQIFTNYFKNWKDSDYDKLSTQHLSEENKRYDNPGLAKQDLHALTGFMVWEAGEHNNSAHYKSLFDSKTQLQFAEDNNNKIASNTHRKILQKWGNDIKPTTMLKGMLDTKIEKYLPSKTHPTDLPTNVLSQLLTHASLPIKQACFTTLCFELKNCDNFKNNPKDLIQFIENNYKDIFKRSLEAHKTQNPALVQLISSLHKQVSSQKDQSTYEDAKLAYNECREDNYPKGAIRALTSMIKLLEDNPGLDSFSVNEYEDLLRSYDTNLDNPERLANTPSSS